MRFTLASGNWQYNWMGWELHKIQTGVVAEKLLIVPLSLQPWSGVGARGQCFHGDRIKVICLEAVFVPAVSHL